jgi:hypothetical protein
MKTIFMTKTGSAVLELGTKTVILSKSGLPVGQLSFLFGHQQPTTVNRAIIDFISEVMYT